MLQIEVARRAVLTGARAVAEWDGPADEDVKAGRGQRERILHRLVEVLMQASGTRSMIVSTASAAHCRSDTGVGEVILNRTARKPKSRSDAAPSV